MVFSLYIILHGWTDFFFFMCPILFFLNTVFLCLCFYAFVFYRILCFIGNIVIIISYHGWPARWVIPFWQPACLYICVHMCVFLMANKLCCCYSTVEILTTLDGPAVIDDKARYWSTIAIFAPLRIPRWNITITFGVEKLEQCNSVTRCKKWSIFIRFDRIHERDRWTDKHCRGWPGQQNATLLSRQAVECVSAGCLHAPWLGYGMTIGWAARQGFVNAV